MGAPADARTQVSGFYDRARRGFGILVKKQRRARRLRRPETIQDSPRYRARDHPPLIIKSRGFLNPLRKRLCADPIYYNVYKSSYDISRSKASAASRHGKHYNDFSVGRYVILPNHIHLLVGDSDVAPYSLDRWVGAWKACVSRRWPKEEDKPIRQRSFWDRQMWSDQTCDVKWLYVRNNPVRHGLVKHPDDWPFQGVMNDQG
jgi:REP element-mobilizing transposase RayT